MNKFYWILTSTVLAVASASAVYAQKAVEPLQKTAQTAHTQTTHSSTVKVIPLQPSLPFKRPGPATSTPDDKGTGTAQRGGCPGTKDALKLMFLPSDKWQVPPASSPTLWFYLEYPQGRSTPPMAELSVEDRATSQRLLPKIQTIELPSQTSSFGLELPYQLKRDRKYRWYLYLPCTDSSQPVLIQSDQTDRIQLEGNLPVSISR